MDFKGEGLNEVGFIKNIEKDHFKKLVGESPAKNLTGKDILFIDPKYYRPTEVDILLGDPSKAKEKLGWEPEYDVIRLAADMMEYDIPLMKEKREHQKKTNSNTFLHE